ncbi:MAG: protein-glutamate O-methyltransferase CheR [Anaerolineae bacterium]
MRFYAETLGLAENTFILLRDLIHERTGLFFGSDRRELLADKLSPRVVDCGFESFIDYYYLLKYDTARAGEWRRLMNALAVPETYFWREADHINALVNVVVPALAQQGRPLRIWSAACASGEEPLTLALALTEAGWMERLPIEIRASDASEALLDKARAGVFRERSFRALPPVLQAKYFEPNGSGWCVAPQILRAVSWQTANLTVEADVAALATADIIFCRNVFIYFSDAATAKVVNTFYRLMPSPGYLFVGTSESLLRLGTRFELEDIGNTFVYVKR